MGRKITLTEFIRYPLAETYEAFLLYTADKEQYSQKIVIPFLEAETMQRRGFRATCNYLRERIEEAQEALLNRVAMSDL